MIGIGRTGYAGQAGKPYDKDLGAHVFPYRNYRAEEGRWMSADPAGFPDRPNRHYYAAVPTMGLDPLGLQVVLEQLPTDYPTAEAWQDGGMTEQSLLGYTTKYRYQMTYTDWISAGGQTTSKGADSDFHVTLSNAVQDSFSTGGEINGQAVSVSFTKSWSSSVTSSGGADFSYTNPTSSLPADEQRRLEHKAYYSEVTWVTEKKSRHALNSETPWADIAWSLDDSVKGVHAHWAEKVLEL